MGPLRARSRQELLGTKYVIFKMRQTANRPGKELGSMYDYLAKIILLGPSGSGKYARSKKFVERSMITDNNPDRVCCIDL